MSATESKSSPAATFLGIFVGIILMVGGMYLSANPTITPQITALNDTMTNDQHIPLNLYKTIATIGVFLILFPVIKGFFVKPLQVAIEERTTTLENTFSEAEQLRADMAQMKADYERQLAETEANAREQIQTQIKEAQEFRKAIQTEAQAQADEYKQRAIAEIDSEKQRVLTDLRVNVTNLSLMATERILGENMDSDRNRRLIDDFLATAEVKH